MLEHYLRYYINYNQDDWARWISLAQFVYNNIKQSVTKLISKEILFKTRSQLRIDVDTNNKYLKVKKIVDRVTSLQNVRTQLTERLQKTHEMQKKYYDKMHTSMKFNVRDRVLIKIQNINLLRSSRKLDHKYTDSFEIIVLWDKQIYKLKLSSCFRMIHLVFHVSLLESYREKKNEQQSSSSKIIDEQDEYYIEKILDQKNIRDKTHYLVQWLEWESQKDFWESAKELQDTETLNIFLERQIIKQSNKRRSKWHKS